MTCVYLVALQGEEAHRYWQNIHTLITELGLTHLVHCTGYVSAEHASHCLSGSDIGVLPFHPGVTLKSGSLLALLAHRLPTVISQSHETDPELIQADWIKRVPPRNAEALAHSLTDLLGDRPQRQHFAKAGHEFVQRRSWGAIGSQHRMLYEGLLGKGGVSAMGRWNVRAWER